MARIADQPSETSTLAVAQSQASRLFPDASPAELKEIVGIISRTPQVAPASIGAGNVGTRNVALDQPVSVQSPGVFEPGLKNLEGLKNFGEGVVNNLDAIGGVIGLGGGLPGSIGGAAVGGFLKSALQTPGDDPIAALRGARDASSIEFLGGKAFDVVPGSIARLFRGSRDVAQRYTEAFAEFGLRPSLQEISNTTFVEGARTIIGSFPLFRGPFVKFQTIRMTQADRAIADFIEGASPDTLLLRSLAQKDVRLAKELNEKLSGEFFAAIPKGIKFFKNQRDESFKVFRSDLRQVEQARLLLGTPFESKLPNTLIRMNEILKTIDADTVILRSGKKQKEIPDMAKTIKFIEDLAFDLPEKSSLNKLIAMKKRIGRQIDIVDDPNSSRLLTGVKEGVEEDIHSLIASAPELAESYANTLSFSTDLLTLLESLSARSIKQVDKKLGRQGAQMLVEENGQIVLRNAGTKDIVTLMDSLANSASPAQIREFAKMLAGGSGEPRMRKMMGDALGRKIARAMDRSFKEAAEKSESGLYKPESILRNMDLFDPTTARFAATVELFEQAGVDPNRVRKLVDLLDGMFSAKPGKAAQFVQRKAILGGFKGAIRGLLPGVSMGASAAAAGGTVAAGGGLGLSGAVGGLVLFLSVRSIGKTLTSPWRARAVIAVADAAQPSSVRARALVSLITDPAVASTLLPGSDDGMGNRFNAADYRRELSEALVMLKTEGGREEFFQRVDDELSGLKSIGKKGFRNAARFVARELSQEEPKVVETPLPSLRPQ